MLSKNIFSLSFRIAPVCKDPGLFLSPVGPEAIAHRAIKKEKAPPNGPEAHRSQEP